MKSVAMTLALLGALPMCVAAQTTREDVKKLAKAGVSDDVILSFIRANGSIPNLSSDDVVDLKSAGVSDRVLSVLLNREAAPRQDPPRETEVRTETQIVERKVYVPTTTYVYSDDSCYTPSYSHSYYSYPRYTYSYPRYSYVSYPYTSYRSYSCSPSISFGVSYGRGWRGGYYYGRGRCW